MKSIRNLWKLVIIASVCIFFSTPAFGHTLWLNATFHYPEIFSHPKFAPEPRAKTVIYFGWGHKVPANDLFDLKYLGDFFLIEPDGGKTQLKPGDGGFKATELTLKKEGGRIIAASVKPGFHGNVEGKEDFYKMRYEMYAKTMISVGKAADDFFMKPTGHRFEIIPMQNPQTLKPGDWLEIQVLLDGKPAKGVEITAFSYAKPWSCAVANLSYKQTAKLRIADSHGPWIINAKLELPPTDEFKDKCETMYFVSTLTFEVP